MNLINRGAARTHKLNQFRLVAMSTVMAVAFMQGALVPVVNAAPNPTVQGAQDPITKARALAKAGKLSAAVIELKNFIKAYPKNNEARAELASIYLQGNDGKSAEREWRAAIQAGYPMSKAMDGLGLSLLVQGQAPKLLKEFDPAKYQGEMKARVHLMRAQAHFSLSEIDRAKTEVASAQAVAPNYFGVHLAASRLRQSEGDLKAAEAEIDLALKLSPKNVESRIQKGELRGAQGDPDGALTYFDGVLAENRNDLRARLGRIATLVSNKKSETAEAEVDEVLKTAAGSPVASYFKALLLAQRGKRDEALAWLSRISGVEKLPPALYLLAALHLGKGEVEQAQKFINAYVSKAPDDLRGQLLMVSLRLARGEVAAALPKLEELKTKLPNDYATSLLLGNAYLSVGRFADATAQFKAATTASPTASDATMGLAQSLLGQGKSDESAKILQSLASDGQGTNRTTALLVLSLLQSKDYNGALKAVADFSAKEPKNPAAPYLKASVDAARGDKVGMRKDLEAALALDPKFIPAELTLAQIDRADGKGADAAKHFQNIIAHTPTNVEAHVGLATVALDQNDKVGALGWLRKAIAANPTAPAPRLLTINFLLTEGKAGDALKEASEFSSKFPSNAIAVDALGVAQLINRDPKGAISSFTKLVSLMKGSAVANVKLASAYRADKRNADAQRSLDAALKIDPSLPDAHRAVVDMTFELEGPDAALKKAQAAQAAMSDKAAGNLLIADTLRAGGKFSEAEVIYKESWKKSPTMALLSAYTQTLEAQGKYAPSRAVISDWLKKNPKDGDARFMLMVNSITSGQYPGAIKEGLVLLKDRPNDVALLNNLAWLNDKTGNAVEAIKLAEQAYSLAPKVAEINDTLGWLLVRNQKADRGASLIKTAYELSPRNPEIAYHYAFVLNAAGKRADAKALLDTALKNPQPFAERKDAEKFLASLK